MPLIPVPYGLRVAGDCIHLEEHPEEKQTLTVILDLIVAGMPLPRIAQTLNDRGLRIRSGSEWTPAAIFNLMPRTIEAGPNIFSSDTWAAQRRQPAI